MLISAFSPALSPPTMQRRPPKPAAVPPLLPLSFSSLLPSFSLLLLLLSAIISPAAAQLPPPPPPSPAPQTFPQGGPCSTNADCIVSPGTVCVLTPGVAVGACRILAPPAAPTALPTAPALPPIITAVPVPITATSTVGDRVIIITQSASRIITTTAAAATASVASDIRPESHGSGGLRTWVLVVIGVVGVIAFLAIIMGIFLCLNLGCFAGRRLLQRKHSTTSLENRNSSRRNILPQSFNDTNDSLHESQNWGLKPRGIDAGRASTKLSISSAFPHQEMSRADIDSLRLSHPPAAAAMAAGPSNSLYVTGAASSANHHQHLAPFTVPAAAAAAHHHSKHHAAAHPYVNPPIPPPIVPIPDTSRSPTPTTDSSMSEAEPRTITDTFPTASGPCEYGYWDAQRRFHQGFRDEEGFHRGYWDADGAFWKTSLDRNQRKDQDASHNVR
ncbi:hypothetical protein HDU89_000883 [Geranomyces variabilis]|nr:hypothetical protein HDU89_000883 [Geranomyces variabilis]